MIFKIFLPPDPVIFILSLIIILDHLLHHAQRDLNDLAVPSICGPGQSDHSHHQQHQHPDNDNQTQNQNQQLDTTGPESSSTENENSSSLTCSNSNFNPSDETCDPLSIQSHMGAVTSVFTSSKSVKSSSSNATHDESLYLDAPKTELKSDENSLTPDLAKCQPETQNSPVETNCLSNGHLSQIKCVDENENSVIFNGNCTPSVPDDENKIETKTTDIHTAQLNDLAPQTEITAHSTDSRTNECLIENSTPKLLNPLSLDSSGVTYNPDLNWAPNVQKIDSSAVVSLNSITNDNEITADCSSSLNSSNEHYVNQLNSICDSTQLKQIITEKTQKITFDPNNNEIEIELSPGCDDLQQLVLDESRTKAMDSEWHEKHFSCWQCDENLTAKKYVLRDDKSYCIKCFESNFSSTCDACKKIIGIDSKVSLSSKRL